MKKLALALALTTVIGAVAGCLSACTPAQTAGDVTAAITVEQTLCILNNTMLKNADIATTCGIANTLLPAIEQILGAHKAAEHREGLAR